jgi:hypothetical protein
MGNFIVVSGFKRNGIKRICTAAIHRSGVYGGAACLSELSFDCVQTNEGVAVTGGVALKGTTANLVISKRRTLSGADVFGMLRAKLT